MVNPIDIECPNCGAYEGRECWEIDPNTCSCCGWVGCRTIDVPFHEERIKAAKEEYNNGCE